MIKLVKFKQAKNTIHEWYCCAEKNVSVPVEWPMYVCVRVRACVRTCVRVCACARACMYVCMSCVCVHMYVVRLCVCVQRVVI